MRTLGSYGRPRAGVRRNVVDGYKSGGSWSNYYTVKLTCGHSQVVSLRLGKMPKKATCYECTKERDAQEKKA